MGHARMAVYAVIEYAEAENRELGGLSIAAICHRRPFIQLANSHPSMMDMGGLN